MVDLWDIFPRGGCNISAEIDKRSMLESQKAEAQDSKTFQQLSIFGFIRKGVSSLLEGSDDQRNRHERSWRSTTK